MIYQTTKSGLLSRFYPGVVQHRPAVVLMTGGTNDLWWDLDIKMILAGIFTTTCQAEHHDIVPLTVKMLKDRFNFA